MSDACSSRHDAYAFGSLSITNFEALFKFNSKAFADLADKVRNGDGESIEMMHQIALQGTSLGTTAENLLFDLFSGEETGRAGIAHDIEQQSLKLFEATQHSTPPSLFNQTDSEKASSKFRSPSKLLYMAGSAAVSSNSSVSLAHIAHIFKADLETRDWYSSPEASDREIWNHDRMLFNCEIDAYAAQIGWNIPCLPENNIVEYILLNGGVPCPSVMAINHSNHYSLIYIFNADTSSPSATAVFFSSQKGCGGPISEELNAIGLPCTISDADLQANTPNACGVFVIEMMRSLKSSALESTPPEDRIEAFIKSFQALSNAEQSQFNISKRQQIHGSLLGLMYSRIS